MNIFMNKLQVVETVLNLAKSKYTYLFQTIKQNAITDIEQF